MEKFKFLSKDKISQLPKTPGVYAFFAGKKVLYIGKALNLRNRVRQHKLDSVEFKLNRVEFVAYIKTDSEAEALLLEAKLIKKYQPKYNTVWKDDKNYFYVGVTKEEFPRVFITHQPPKVRSTKHEIRNKFKIQNSKFKTLYLGPFVDGKALKKALAELRKRIPFRACKTLPKKPCLWFHLDQCLAPCLWLSQRIEAYDISNIQGKEATGAMITFINGKPDKNFYRRFKIKGMARPNDLAMLKEVLSRRLKHKEWPYPDLMLIDGGKPQLSAAVNSKSEARNSKLIKAMALAKKKNELFIEGQKRPVLLKDMPREIFNLILQLRDEAHRFARNYHLRLRERDLLD